MGTVHRYPFIDKATMGLTAVPFGATDWSTVEPVDYVGLTGTAYWRTCQLQNVLTQPGPKAACHVRHQPAKNSQSLVVTRLSVTDIKTDDWAARPFLPKAPSSTGFFVEQADRGSISPAPMSYEL